MPDKWHCPNAISFVYYYLFFYVVNNRLKKLLWAFICSLLICSRDYKHFIHKEKTEQGWLSYLLSLLEVKITFKLGGSVAPSLTDI